MEPDLKGDHTSKGRGWVASGDSSLLLNQMDCPTSTSDFFPSTWGQEAGDPRARALPAPPLPLTSTQSNGTTPPATTWGRKPLSPNKLSHRRGGL